MKVLEGPRQPPPDSLAVPAWLADDPELRRRDITLVECLRPPTVFCTSWFTAPQYVVKIVEPDSEAKQDSEAAICAFLQLERTAPDNHTIPCDIIHAEKTVLLMPYLPSMKAPSPLDGRWLEAFLDAAYQLLEVRAARHDVASESGQGVDYLHRKRIAHMDICPANLLAATPREAALDGRVTAGKLYLIDFDRSLDLRLADGGLGPGPGTHRAVRLPRAQFAPPAGVTHLDPYAWDVHCAGRVLEAFLRVTKTATEPGLRLAPGARGGAGPWVAERLVAWLKGEERPGGCAGACRCRPTARRALRAVSAVRWCLRAAGWCGSAFGFVKDLLLLEPLLALVLPRFGLRGA